MNHAHFLELGAFRSEATFGIALAFTRLLLLFDCSNLNCSCCHRHCSSHWCQDITHKRNCRCRAIRRDGILCRLRHRLNYLHGKHLFVRLVLFLCQLLLLLLFELLHLVVVALRLRYLLVIPLLDGSSLYLQFRLNERSHTRKYRRHARCQRVKRALHRLSEVRVQPLRDVLRHVFEKVLARVVVLLAVLLRQCHLCLLIRFLDTQLLLSIVASSLYLLGIYFIQSGRVLIILFFLL